MEADQVAPPSVILSDGDAFESIKENSRQLYKKTWNKFVMFNDKSDEIQYRVPSKIDLMNYMKNLRNEEGNILLFIFSNMSLLQTIPAEGWDQNKYLTNPIIYIERKYDMFIMKSNKLILICM